jgi:hypothetical protein
VVQEIVTPVDVMDDGVIEEITGAVLSGAGGMTAEQDAVVPPLMPRHCHR